MKLELKDVLGPLLTTAALIGGILQYRATTYDEFVKPVREAQLKLYEEACTKAAQVATLPSSSPVREDSRRDFLQLYYGPLTMVEDFDHGPKEKQDSLTVEDVMRVLKTCLEKEDCKDDTKAIQRLSRALARTCRESLRRSWRYEINLEEDETPKIVCEYVQKLGTSLEQTSRMQSVCGQKAAVTAPGNSR
jgi:hypothetical protein